MSSAEVDAWLSTARFAPFLNEVDGSYERALELYDWHAETSAALQPDGVKQVIVAIERLQKGRAITRGRVVAGLSFGFWAGFFSRRYEELCRQRLHKAFSRPSLVRKDLTHRMRLIQSFRNRVAHHDSLLDQDIEQRIDDMFEIVGWIDREARGWFEMRSRVHGLLARRPGFPQTCPATTATPGAGSR
jgi:hypothetical protein